MRIINIIGILTVFLVAISFSTRSAAGSETIKFQGAMTIEGMPVDKTIPITLSVYESETGEIPVWTKKQSVDVINGIYDFRITSFPDTLSAIQEYYLTVEIETREGPICLGRKRLISILEL